MHKAERLQHVTLWHQSLRSCPCGQDDRRLKRRSTLFNRIGALTGQYIMPKPHPIYAHGTVTLNLSTPNMQRSFPPIENSQFSYSIYFGLGDSIQ